MLSSIYLACGVCAYLKCFQIAYSMNFYKRDKRDSSQNFGTEPIIISLAGKYSIVTNSCPLSLISVYDYEVKQRVSEREIGTWHVFYRTSFVHFKFYSNCTFVWLLVCVCGWYESVGFSPTVSVMLLKDPSVLQWTYIIHLFLYTDQYLIKRGFPWPGHFHNRSSVLV